MNSHGASSYIFGYPIAGTPPAFSWQIQIQKENTKIQRTLLHSLVLNCGHITSLFLKKMAFFMFSNPLLYRDFLKLSLLLVCFRFWLT